MKRLFTLSLLSAALVFNACGSSTTTPPVPSAYLLKTLTTDAAAPTLVNPWGIAFAGSQIWIAQNGTGTTAYYDSTGAQKKTAVQVHGAGGAAGSPTGIVINPNLANYGGSYTIYSNEDGTISGLLPIADSATVIASRASYGAIYKGLALDPAGPSLYASNFKSGSIDIFGPTLTTPKSVSDPNLPAGYAPFGLAVLNNALYVTLALQNGKDDSAGAGFGFVDVFNLDGTFKTRLVSNGALNAPWGLAIAPSSFGDFSNNLLVGNFGDGTINAYDANDGSSKGQLKDAAGAVIKIPGLWGLAVNNGVLYYTAGPNDEKNGVLGTISVK